MKKERILPALAVTGGGVGIFLRRWELAAAIDPVTGLSVPFGLPANWALLALSLGLLAAFLLLCRDITPEFPGGYDQAFYAPHIRYLLAVIPAGGLMLAAGLLGLRDFFAGGAQEGLPRLLLCLLALAAGPCMAFTGLNNYRGMKKGKYSAPLLLLSVFYCLWMFNFYQANSGNPVRLSYVYPLLAIISAALALYFITGFSFERPKTRRTATASLMGGYLCMMALADMANKNDLMGCLLFGATALYLFAHAAVLLGNAAHPPILPVKAEPIPDSVTEEPADE